MHHQLLAAAHNYNARFNLFRNLIELAGFQITEPLPSDVHTVFQELSRVRHLDPFNLTDSRYHITNPLSRTDARCQQLWTDDLQNQLRRQSRCPIFKKGAGFSNTYLVNMSHYQMQFWKNFRNSVEPKFRSSITIDFIKMSSQHIKLT
jgi:hypothetical protein